MKPDSSPYFPDCATNLNPSQVLQKILHIQNVCILWFGLFCDTWSIWGPIPPPQVGSLFLSMFMSSLPDIISWNHVPSSFMPLPGSQIPRRSHCCWSVLSFHLQMTWQQRWQMNRTSNHSSRRRQIFWNLLDTINVELSEMQETWHNERQQISKDRRLKSRLAGHLLKRPNH